MTESKPRHFLRSAFLAVRFEHELTNSEFSDLEKARSFFIDYMHFEEAVLQVIHAISQFELFLLTTSLDHYFFPMQSNDAVQDTRLRANLPVLGYLNSVTSLRDQFPKFKTATKTIAPRSFFEELWDAQKTESIEFAFCERFRNYAQHQTQPVSSASLGGSWGKARDLSETRTSLFVNVADVCKNRKIGNSESNRYQEAFGERADTSLIVRETAGRIGQIVRKLREEISADFEFYLSIYENILDLIPKDGMSISVAKVITTVSGADAYRFDVFSDFSKRAQKLNKMFVMTNNHQHFVSNRARGHAKNS